MFVGYLLLSLLARVLLKINFPKKGKAINLITPSLSSVLEELLPSVAENKNASSENNLVLEERAISKSLILAGNYMFKVTNRNTRTKFEICSKLTIKILVQVFLLLTLNM